MQECIQYIQIQYTFKKRFEIERIIFLFFYFRSAPEKTDPGLAHWCSDSEGLRIRLILKLKD